MSEDFQWNDDHQLELLRSRFEEMIQSGSTAYFDAEEFELLIDFYQNGFFILRNRVWLLIWPCNNIHTTAV